MSTVRLTPFGIEHKAKVLRALLLGLWRVRRAHGVPVGHQLRRYRLFRRAILANATEFYRYQLWDERIPMAERATFLTWLIRRPLERYMNPKAVSGFAQSKVAADAFFRAAGVPVPRRLGVWCPTGVTSDEPGSIRASQQLATVLATAADGAVCKRDLGGGGEQVLVFPRTGGGELYDAAGRRWSIDRLVRRMAGPDAWLLQERLRPHPEIAALIGADELASARIVTCRRADGRIFSPIAVVKLPSTGRGVDNFGAGNVACSVDDAGCLGTAAAGLDGPMVPAHPITGTTLAGFRVPHWSAMVDLAHELHRHAPMLGSVGWDIAITPDGPVLIEPNVWWGNDVVQQACQRGLVRGEFIDFVRECGAEHLLRLEERAALAASG